MPTNDLRMGHYDITCQSEMLIPVVIICVYALIGIITSTVCDVFSLGLELWSLHSCHAVPRCIAPTSGCHMTLM